VTIDFSYFASALADQMGLSGLESGSNDAYFQLVACTAVIDFLPFTLQGLSLCSNSLTGQPFSQCDSELLLFKQNLVPEALTWIWAPAHQETNRCGYPEAIALRNDVADRQRPTPIEY
jgi:hypothetical protein